MKRTMTHDSHFLGIYQALVTPALLMVLFDPPLVRHGGDAPILQVEGLPLVFLLLLPLTVDHLAAHLVGIEDGHFADVLE